MEELVKFELNEEDLKELSAEEIANLKVDLEELIMNCEEILQEVEDDEQDNY